MEQPIQDRFGQLLKWQNKGALILNTQFEPFLRRLLDILGALFGLLLLSPVFIFIAYLIKRDTPGPIFYRGLRVGKGGETFGMLKFRTMYEKPTSYQGPRVTGEGDPRFIGSHLVEQLIKRGADVCALVRYNSRVYFGLLKLMPRGVQDSLHVISGDLRLRSARCCGGG